MRVTYDKDTGEKVFMVPEDEYRQIVKVNREKGRADVKDYIAFCMRNRKSEDSFKGIFTAIGEMIKFLDGHSAFIPNTKGVSLCQFTQEDGRA